MHPAEFPCAPPSSHSPLLRALSAAFPQIAKSGAKGQWSLKVQLGDSDTPGVWSPYVNCSTSVYGACPQQTLTVMGTGLVNVTYAWKNKTQTSIKMMSGTSQVPSTLEFYVSAMRSLCVFRFNHACVRLCGMWHHVVTHLVLHS